MNSKVLYKYRDWTDKFHKKILTENEIYFPSPKQFNDPFDCRISPNFSLLTDAEKTEYIDKITIKYFYELEGRGINIKEKLDTLDNKLEVISMFQKEYDESIFDIQDKSFGIFSLSFIWDNILMWSHYANNHKGFCIGFNERELVFSGVLGKSGIKGGNVEYKKDYPKINPIANIDDDFEKGFTITHTKSADWEYEKEYRILKIFENSKEQRKLKFLDLCISEVILGVDICENDKNDIIEICKSKNIPLYQAYKKDYKFELSRIQIL